MVLSQQLGGCGPQRQKLHAESKSLAVFEVSRNQCSNFRSLELFMGQQEAAGGVGALGAGVVLASTLPSQGTAHLPATMWAFYWPLQNFQCP